jgi:hypothetical protein
VPPPTSWAAPEAVPSPSTERYPTRPVRPAAQTAARVGLWALVALGGLGGCVGILRPPVEAQAPAIPSSGDDADVPAPVAGMAERAVAAWLTARDDDAALLESLYLDPPQASQIDTENLTVEDVSTVAARSVDDGYWAVTVAADVVEQPVASEDGEEAAPVVAVWYVEVGIVGDVEEGLSAVETPSIVAPPSPVADDWLPDRDSADTPAPGDPLVASVEDFLRAFLTGRGDPARYVAPGLDVVALDPAPFADIFVVEMAVERHDDTSAMVWTEVEVTTSAGARQVVAYDMALAQRSGRWEITEMPGVATRVGSGGGDTGSSGSTATTAGSSGTGEPPIEAQDPTVPTSVPQSAFEPDDGA